MDDGSNELKKVAVVGHVSHGKTALTPIEVVSDEVKDIPSTHTDTSVSYAFTNPYDDWVMWDGQKRLSRREIRQRKRNTMNGKPAGYRRDNNRKKKKRKKRR